MQFPYTSPRGAYIWRGDLTDGFLRYKFGGPIFGGAYKWRGLFSEFYGTHQAERFRTDRSCLFSEINSNLNDWCSSFDSCYRKIFFFVTCASLTVSSISWLAETSKGSFGVITIRMVCITVMLSCYTLVYVCKKQYRHMFCII